MTRNYGVISFLFIAAGVLGAVMLALPPLAWLLGLIFTFGAGAIGMILNRHTRGRWFLTGVVAFGLCCGGGFWLARVRDGYRNEWLANQASAGQCVTVQGTVIDRPAAARAGWRFRVALEKSKEAVLQGRVVIYSKSVKVVRYGHRIRITGKYQNSPGRPLGFPGPDERSGAVGRIYVTRPPLLLKKGGLPPPFLWADGARAALLRVGNRFLRPDNAGLLHAMLYGTDLGNSPADRRLLKNLRRTGTIHLLSVSGLHIGFVVAGFSLLLALLKVPRRWRAGPLGLVIVFYMLMTGMEPPVLRAGLMMLLYLGGQFLNVRDGRHASANRLGLAAAGLLLLNPYDLFEVGFQLSVLATLGVVWLAPLFWTAFKVKSGLLKILWESLLLSVAAQMTVLPVIVFYFQQISWSGPLVNILLFAPAWLAVVGGLGAELVGALVPSLGPGLFFPVHVCLGLIRRIVAMVGDQPWSAGWSPVWPWPWMAAYYLALILLVNRVQPNLITGRRLKLHWGRAAIGTLLAANLLLWSIWYVSTMPPYLELDMLDVGQGDSFLLQAPDGKTALVDGGPPGQGLFRVLPFLRARGIERLNLVIVTHGHSDHWGGVVEVLEEIPAERVIAAASAAPFLKMNRGGNLRLIPLRTELRLRLGKQVGIRIWQAAGRQLAGQSRENNRSLVTRVYFAKNQLMLTGDLAGEGEAILKRENPALLRAAVLKIGHHGSNLATGLPFLTRVRPRAALISVGAPNRFGHPGVQTLNRLRSLGIPVFRTDTAGTVTVRLYREKMTVLIEKSKGVIP